MNNSVLTRRDYVNMFYLNGKEVEAIVFTKGGEELARCRWFCGGGTNNPYEAIYLPFEVKSRRKHPARVEAYSLKHSSCKSIYIYIPIELLSSVEVEEHISGYKSKMDERYFNRFSFVCEAEKCEYTRNDVGEVVSVNTGAQMHRISFEYNNTFEPTELGRRCIELVEVAQSNGINGFSAYDFEKLLQVFDIIVK